MGAAAATCVAGEGAAAAGDEVVGRAACWPAMGTEPRAAMNEQTPAKSRARRRICVLTLVALLATISDDLPIGVDTYGLRSSTEVWVRSRHLRVLSVDLVDFARQPTQAKRRQLRRNLGDFLEGARCS